MVYVLVIKYNEIYLFENFQVVLQDLLVAANGFFLMKRSSTLGRGLDSGQRAWHLTKDNLTLAYYNLLLFLPSFRCDCNLALKSFFFVSFFLSSTNYSYQSFREGGKKKKCIYIMYMLSSFFKSLLYNILFLAFVVSLMCDNRWSQFLFFVNLWHFNVIL